MCRAFRLLLVLAGSYIFVFISCTLLTDSLIFNPPRGTEAPPEAVRLKTGDVDISLLYMPVEGSKHTILYSHGNGEDLSLLLPFLKEYNRAGYSVVAYDYPGYGDSSGRPTEDGACKSAQAVYDYMVSDLKLRPAEIIAHGRSLGGAVAVELAVQRPLAGLIVESSFTAPSRIYTGVSLMPDRKYNSIVRIARSDCPLLIIHGTDDTVVPFRHGEELYRRSGRREKVHLWVKGAGHNDLVQVAGETYWEAIDLFVEYLER